MSKVVFKWSFTPPDYFEEPVEINCHKHVIQVSSGKAEVAVDSTGYDADPTIRKALHDCLNDRFLAIQLMTHRSYDLSRSAMSRLHPCGRKDVFLECDPIRFGISVSSADIQIRDSHGNIVSDSKRDRIDKQNSLGMLINKYRDSDITLKSLLRSYDAAVRDQDNEFVHLYEIREALSVKFGGERNACSELAISSSEWDRFGRLCNNEPLFQGRHRGKNPVALRNANQSELIDVRNTARKMIDNYLFYLESITTN